MPVADPLFRHERFSKYRAMRLLNNTVSPPTLAIGLFLISGKIYTVRCRVSTANSFPTFDQFRHFFHHKTDAGEQCPKRQKDEQCYSAKHRDEDFLYHLISPTLYQLNKPPLGLGR